MKTGAQQKKSVIQRIKRSCFICELGCSHLGEQTEILFICTKQKNINQNGLVELILRVLLLLQRSEQESEKGFQPPGRHQTNTDYM